MKKIVIIAAAFLFHINTTSAQFYKSLLPSPEFTNSLEKIVLDFRFNFKNIKGDNIISEGSTQTFESVIKLPGTEQSTITYYNSKMDTTASWGAIAYKGTSYNEAVRVYENIFRLVKKSHLNWIDRSLMRFSGDLTTAKQEIGFASSVLYLELEDIRYKKFVAEVELLNDSYDNWTVQIDLHNKKKDSERY